MFKDGCKTILFALKEILSDSTTWVAPQGNVGDKFTLVVHASTGSYGTNVRYYFEYVCD